jgi:uncharacterized protein YcnI
VNTTRMHHTLAAALVFCAATVQAHVALEEPKAFAGTGYKAVLRISHGCESTATHTVVVDLPAGFRGAKPMPKAGWKISITRATLPQPYESHGRTISDDVARITWTATSPDNALLDEQFDEFVLRGQAPAQTGPAWFKVRQLCVKGEWNWAEVPAAGADGKFSTQGLKAPAVRLDVHPAEHAGHMH